jgi:hypothetical protein
MSSPGLVTRFSHIWRDRWTIDSVKLRARLLVVVAAACWSCAPEGDEGLTGTGGGSAGGAGNGGGGGITGGAAGTGGAVGTGGAPGTGGAVPCGGPCPPNSTCNVNSNMCICNQTNAEACGTRRCLNAQNICGQTVSCGVCDNDECCNGAYQCVPAGNPPIC